VRSRFIVTAVLGALLMLASAGSADAHVSVAPETATRGGDATLTFRVPNERDIATTKVEVALPEDHPIASVTVRPAPGWTVAVQTIKLTAPLKSDYGEVTEAASRVGWTGGTIAPGQFEEFEISAGPLPENADHLVFKVLQTYADGQVVRWIDEPIAGGPEPDHPAPTVTLIAASAAPSSGETATKTPASAPTKATTGRDGTGVALAATALAVAIGALLVSVLAFARSRRTRDT
jgi:uncharacterized protein YcnI